MFPLLLPLLVLGLFVVIGRHGQTQTQPVTVTPPRALASGVPSPITVLGHLVRDGIKPPPTVILCAIAEAQTLGHMGLADDIVRTFIVPVVRAAEAQEIARARDANPRPFRRSSAPPPMQPSALDVSTTTLQDGTKMTIDSVDDDTRAALAQMNSPQGQAFGVSVIGPDPQGMPRAPAPVIAAGQLAPVRHRAQTAPIRGVAPDQWEGFVSRVAREEPTFSTPRHVGQFRQRRDRLAEIGINPDQIASRPDAQRAAFEVDMSDAYRHATDAGLVDQHLGSRVAVGPDDDEHEVSLSGMLGVIQAAGLEGACEWLEKPADRERFPHTTRAFLRCNGVF